MQCSEVNKHLLRCNILRNAKRAHPLVQAVENPFPMPTPAQNVRVLTLCSAATRRRAKAQSRISRAAPDTRMELPVSGPISA